MPLAELVDQVDSLLAAKDDRRLKSLLSRLQPHEIADIIDKLPNGKRKTFGQLPPEKQAEVIVLLSEWSRSSLLPRMTDTSIARFLHFLDEDRATDILQILPQMQ